MGYAKHVGRVGALAVALGIGAAVATTPGVALAGPEESEPGIDAPKTPETPSEPESVGGTTPPTERQDPGEVIRRNIERAADDLRDGIRKVVTGVVRSSGGAITSTHRNASNPSNGNVSPVIDEEKEQLETLDPPKDEKKSATFVEIANPPSGFTLRWRAPHAEVNTRGVPKPIAKAIDGVEDAVQQSINAVEVNKTPIGSTAVGRNTFSTLDSLETEDQQQAPTGFVAPIAIITNVVNAALAPFLNPTPGQPAPQNPILWAVLGWVRRQFQETPFGKIVLNRAPVGVEEPVIGEIDGTDNLLVTGFATDPDGDDVETVGVTNGAHGTARINDDGSVTYDPDNSYTGPDTFTVTVSDESDGFHLHGLSGLFRPDGGHTTTVEVRVLVNHEDSGPLVIKESGAVEKTVTINPDALGGADPEKYVGRTYVTPHGTATITAYNNVDKTYTIEYRPNANLRLQGYTTEPPQPQSLRMFSAFSAPSSFETAALAPTTDTVTVTVGEPGNEQTFTFQVPVTQSRLKVDTDGLAVGDGPTLLRVNEAGTRLYVVSDDGMQVTAYDTTTNTQVGAPILIAGGATAMKVEGNHLYVLRGSDGEIDVINVENDANTLVDMEAAAPGETEADVDPLRLPKQPSPVPGAMAINDAGTRLYILNGDSTVSVVDITEDTPGFGNVIESREIAKPDGVGFASSIVVRGGKLYLADYTGGTVRAISLNETTGYGEQIGTPIAVGSPYVMAATPDGADHDDIYVLDPASGTVSIIDTTNNQVTTVKVGAFPSDIAFSPDGSIAYIAGTDSLSIINTSSRTFVLTTITDATPEGAPGYDYVAASGDQIYLNDRFTATSGSDISGNTVTVVSFFAGVNQGGPQFTDVDMGNTNPITGAVPIRVEVDDEDDDAVSVIVTQPANGRVTVTPNADGSYTVKYTPTGQARMDAFDTAGEQTETFLITVTDGDQIASQEVEVTIAPAESGVTEIRPWDLNNGFVVLRGAAMAANGDILLTVLRPDSLVNTQGFGAELINASDPSNPTHIFDTDTSQTGHLNPTIEDVVVVGGRTYVLNQEDGSVAVFDGDAPGTPISFAGGQPIAVFADSDNNNAYALVAYQDSGDPTRYDVSVVDLDDPDEVIGVAYTTSTGFNGGINGQYSGYADGTVGADGRIYVTDVAGRSVSVIDHGTTTSVPITGGRPLSIAANPANGEVYVTVLNDPTGPGNSTMRVIEVNSGDTIATITSATQGVAASDAFSDMAISPDGHRIYVTVPSSRSVAVINTDTRALSGFSTEDMGLRDYPARILFAPSGNEVYVIGSNGAVAVVTFADTAVSV